jgi:hypothetical protein
VRVADREKPLAIKRENLALSVIKSPPPVPKLSKFLISAAMHVLIPCHVTDMHRVDLFKQCALSVALQEHRQFSVFVSISGEPACRNRAMQITQEMNQFKDSKLNWFVVDTGVEKRAQFEHYRHLLGISILVHPDAWLMFLDNDDMFHPQRVSLFKEFAERPHPNDRDMVAFNCGEKLLVDSDKVGEDCITVERIIGGDDTVVEFTTLVSRHNIQDLSATEYFDFCVHTSVLKRFMEITPTELLSHSFCDCRFGASVSSLSICQLIMAKPFAPKWLIAHYKVKQTSKDAAFARGGVSNSQFSSRWARTPNEAR